MASVMKSLTRSMMPEERETAFANQNATEASYVSAYEFARMGVAVGLHAGSSTIVVFPDSDFGQTSKDALGKSE